MHNFRQGAGAILPRPASRGKHEDDTDNSIVAEESSGAVRVKYIVDSEGKLQVVKISRQFSKVTDWFRSAFLPEGYPASVSADYLAYQKWDSLQALCSSVTGLLSTQAILKGVGVGQATATPTAAAIQWAVRDGTSMVGKILFAWMHGSNLDNNAKTWRFVADMLNDFAVGIDMIAPVFPSYFLILACIGSVLRAVVGTAGASTRAAFTVHQARMGNAADVQAKDSSQETAVALSGLILGLILTPMVSESTTGIWILFLVFSFLHLFFNYNACCTVTFDTLNQQRAAIVIRSYLDTHGNTVLSPEQVNLRERVLYFESWQPIRIKLGARLEDLGNYSWTRVASSLVRFQDERYVLWVTTNQSEICVCLDLSATATDIHRAFVHAAVVRNAIIARRALVGAHADWSAGPPLSPSGSTPALLAQSEQGVQDLITSAHQYVRGMFADYEERLLHSGWKLDYMRFGESEWRITWDAKHGAQPRG